MLIFSAVHVAAVLAWFALPDLPFTVPRGYLLIKNVIWALAGSVAAVALFVGAPWSLPLARLGAIGIPLWFLTDRALLAQGDLSRRSFPLAAVGVLAGAALAWWLLSRPSVKVYLRSDLHE